MLDAQPPLDFVTAPEGARRVYKTPEPQRLRSAERYRAIKAAGGSEYEAMKAQGRVRLADWKKTNPDRVAAHWLKYKRTKPFKTALCAAARSRGRNRGLEATIRAEDLIWPTHCPVLGIALDYPERSGMRGNVQAQPNWPSLDRWDNAKGYVPGNVFVISFRANSLKNSATYAEILKVAKYVAKRPQHE